MLATIPIIPRTRKHIDILKNRSDKKTGPKNSRLKLFLKTKVAAMPAIVRSRYFFQDLFKEGINDIGIFPILAVAQLCMSGIN